MTRPNLQPVLLAVALSSALVAAQPAPEPPVESEPVRGGQATSVIRVVEPRTPCAETIESADDLLCRLEEEGDSLDTLSARVRFVRLFGIAGDTQTRTGLLRYRSRFGAGGQDLRQFAIEFTQKQVGVRIEDEIQTYAFDGQWLTRVEQKEKLFIRDLIVRPGEQADPLRIGSGPFPVPIGQRKADVQQRYDTRLADQHDGLDGDEHASLRAFVAQGVGSYQLVLTPKPEYADEDDFVEIRLWYQRDSLLPRLARTLEADFDESTAMMFDVRTNDRAEIEAKSFRPDPPTGYTVRVNQNP